MVPGSEGAGVGQRASWAALQVGWVAEQVAEVDPQHANWPAGHALQLPVKRSAGTVLHE